MSAGRDRIPPVRHTNQPAARPARPDPDDDQPTATPAAPASLPVPAPAVAAPTNPAPRNLGTFLGATEGADDRDSELRIPLSALTRRPRLDPDADLDQLNADVPKYYKQALRSQAFLEHVHMRDLVREGLRRVLDPTLLAKCREEEARNS